MVTDQLRLEKVSTGLKAFLYTVGVLSVLWNPSAFDRQQTRTLRVRAEANSEA